MKANLHKVVARLTGQSEEAASSDLKEEWDRVAAIIQKQITLGKPSAIPSNKDAPTLVSCRVKSNITPSLLKAAFKKAGYVYRHGKGEYEFSFAWNDEKQRQWVIMPNLGLVSLMTY